MSDTPAKVQAMVADRHRRMTPDERARIASGMFDTARAIVESSLPENLSYRERRLALARRIYGDEISNAALLAYADWHGG